MKTTFVLIQALLIANVVCLDLTNRPPLFTIPIFGFTDIDGINFAEGVASGSFGRDLRSQWSGCVMGFPSLIIEMKGLFTDLASTFTNPAEIFSNFSKLQKIANFVFDIIKTGPGDVKGCEELVNEGTQSVAWVVKHISLTTLTTGLLANVLANIFVLATDIWGMVTDLFSKDYYKIGYDGAEIMMLLIN